VFTALGAGAGTTTSLLNLAVVAGKSGRRTCVVDANYSRPAAAARVGAGASIGLWEVLAGKVALEQVVQATTIEGLSVLPAGTAFNSAPTNIDAIKWVLAWLRQRFDLILVDAPAWDAQDGLRALLPAAMSVYLVVDISETDKPEIRVVTRQVAKLGSRLGGLIVAQ
jgi:tyrosine-protein kinase Etk/Wzc